MKTENIDKREYFPPIITYIQLDNEISLALESDPPAPENEIVSIHGDSLTNKPFFT